LVLIDFFSGSPFVVELEKDLSLKKQLLDVVILRKEPGHFAEPMPEGLEDLATHNLITFKSHHEALDDWALKELTGHYVNYRKQISPSFQELLPEDAFRLYAVCARFPQKLASQGLWEEKRPGIYECRRGTDRITVVVLRHLPQIPHNAVWHLFSAVPEQIAFGAQVYRQRSPDMSRLVLGLLQDYATEGLAMPYTMEDFRREFDKQYEEELLKRMTPEKLLKIVPVEELLKMLPAEERLKGLPLEERFKGLSAEEIEQYLRQLKKSTSPENPRSAE
jgi:hypothetical protein